jgi:hypothetical protein
MFSGAAPIVAERAMRKSPDFSSSRTSVKPITTAARIAIEMTIQ